MNKFVIGVMISIGIFLLGKLNIEVSVEEKIANLNHKNTSIKKIIPEGHLFSLVLSAKENSTFSGKLFVKLKNELIYEKQINNKRLKRFRSSKPMYHDPFVGYILISETEVPKLFKSNQECSLIIIFEKDHNNTLSLWLEYLKNKSFWLPPSKPT